jgi:hypothetical protein
MNNIKVEAEDLINYTINFNSPQNVAHVLFDVLKLQVPQDKYSGKKSANTRKGNRSTSEAILKKLESQHKLPSMILGMDFLFTLFSFLLFYIIMIFWDKLTHAATEYRHCQKLLSNWVDSLVGQARVDKVQSNLPFAERTNFLSLLG